MYSNKILFEKICAGMKELELRKVLKRIRMWALEGKRASLPKLKAILWNVPRLKLDRKRCKYSANFTCQDRKALFHLQQRCQYCGRSSTKHLTVDRIDSTKGYTWGNVQCLCFLCNRMKGNLSEKTFFSFVISFLKENK